VLEKSTISCFLEISGKIEELPPVDGGLGILKIFPVTARDQLKMTRNVPNVKYEAYQGEYIVTENLKAWGKEDKTFPWLKMDWDRGMEGDHSTSKYECTPPNDVVIRHLARLLQRPS
jgi:hypothetical protein